MLAFSYLPVLVSPRAFSDQFVWGRTIQYSLSQLCVCFFPWADPNLYLFNLHVNLKVLLFSSPQYMVPKGTNHVLSVHPYNPSGQTHSGSESERHSIVSDSLRLHGLRSPWNSLGQRTGAGSLSLRQNT